MAYCKAFEENSSSMQRFISDGSLSRIYLNFRKDKN